MLGSLARWLRFLGYDTLYPKAMSDAEILRLAGKEGRILITRDRQLACRAGPEAVLLTSLVLDEQILQLGATKGLDFESPGRMMRCPKCNAVLAAASKEEVEQLALDRKSGAPGGAIPLFADDTPLAIPYRNHVSGNIFWDCDNGMIFPCNGSVISGNVFQPTGYAYSMTQVLNTTVQGNPGDDNLVVGNYLPGSYTVVGGYSGGAADVWLGNYATDTGEAGVGDNGLTILPPA
jgi:hypothetical protein